jgi:hypothetical protein
VTACATRLLPVTPFRLTRRSNARTILVYAHREDSPLHQTAFQRIRELAEARVTWAIPWPCLHEFLAIVTHRRIYFPPTPLPKALDQVDAWLESPTLDLLAESPAHWQTLRALLSNSRVVGGTCPRRAGCRTVSAARRARVMVSGP